MDDMMLYWVQLAEILGYGNHSSKEILEAYATPKEFFEAGVNEWRKFYHLTPKIIKRLGRADFKRAQEIIGECEKLGHEIITYNDERYPKRLKNISNPPVVLYVWGKLPKVDEKVCVAVVGTRNATPYGMNSAFKLGYDLASAGAVVVSGGAMGIDCTAQKGALAAGGEVVCVLGCGIANRYLMENAGLRQKISKSGAVISEYPPYHAAAKWTFPMRNRIISGLSNGTVVVEAGERSGALITANLALEQNRDVFAVPGDINRRESKGTNKLIQICAKPVMGAKDILNEYENLYSNIDLNKEAENKKEITTYNEKKELPANLSETAKKVYDKITNEPIHIDELSSILKLKIEEILQAVTELELYALVKQLPGKRYKTKD